MPAVSPDRTERARKNLTLILRRLASVGQVRIADGLGISEATVSRWKAEEAEQCAAILALLGVKVVPEEMRCFDPQKIGAILDLAKAHLAEIEKPEQLAWEE